MQPGTEKNRESEVQLPGVCRLEKMTIPRLPDFLSGKRGIVVQRL